jgi:hypothetical protein
MHVYVKPLLSSAGSTVRILPPPASQIYYRTNFFFNLCKGVGGAAQLGPLSTSDTGWPIVPAPGDYDDGESGGMKIGRGKPATAPLCPPQIPLDQTRDRTRAAAVGSQRITT